MKKLDLESLCKEAIAKGLNEREVETAKRQYYFGILHYEERHPVPDLHRFGSAIVAMVHHQRMAEYCGEAYARKYIREIANNNKEA